ncbi:hypothetical protein BDZ91DRAFT_731940 [Kalaharituber pfeilii]|nr:hypothetical protein BDZ91DRAFT_731940 [Kalaharituber pfeilii]
MEYLNRISQMFLIFFPFCAILTFAYFPPLYNPTQSGERLRDENIHPRIDHSLELDAVIDNSVATQPENVISETVHHGIAPFFEFQQVVYIPPLCIRTCPANDSFPPFLDSGSSENVTPPAAELVSTDTTPAPSNAHNQVQEVFMTMIVDSFKALTDLAKVVILASWLCFYWISYGDRLLGWENKKRGDLTHLRRYWMTSRRPVKILGLTPIPVATQHTRSNF